MANADVCRQAFSFSGVCLSRAPVSVGLKLVASLRPEFLCAGAIEQLVAKGSC